MLCLFTSSTKAKWQPMRLSTNFLCYRRKSNICMFSLWLCYFPSCWNFPIFREEGLVVYFRPGHVVGLIVQWECPLVFPVVKCSCVGNTVKTWCERWWEAGYRKRGNKSSRMWHHRLQRQSPTTAFWSRTDKQWSPEDLVLFGYNIL